MQPSTTCLNLLTREGGVSVTFHHVLSPNEYDELYHSITVAETTEEIKQIAATLAQKWECFVVIEPCT